LFTASWAATNAPVMAGGARAAVGLQHVAVEVDGALAQLLQIEHGAQRAADQALDFLVRPLCLPRAASRSPRVWVARGSMPYSAVTQPSPLPLFVAGHFFFDRRGAQHRVAPNSISTDPSAWMV
jgi:hypothetical protein